MSRQPKNLPQTTEQMLVTNEQQKPTFKKRREMLEANKDTVSNLIGNLADRLEEAEIREKINLRDVNTVKAQAMRYIRSCQISGVLPTMAGLALAFGVAAETLSRFMSAHPEEESAKWLIVVKQQFGDLVNQSALNGAVAPIPAIFTLKANYGWRDDPEPEVQNNDGREDLTPDAIAAKWKDLPD